MSARIPPAIDEWTKNHRHKLTASRATIKAGALPQLPVVFVSRKRPTRPL